jgi:hypothetical protein
MLSPEARVFDGVPASPRAVTMGPKRAREVTQPFGAAPGPFKPEERSIEDDDADVDLFVGWTFRRLSAVPAEHSEEETKAPAAFHERFDDDAPLLMNKSVIEEPSIVESISLVPNDFDWHSGAPHGDADASSRAFSMGSLPSAFDDGTLSIRQLPLQAERASSPAATTKGDGPRRRSMGTAVAFLLAGCCVGAVAGLVHHQVRATTAPRVAMVAAVAPVVVVAEPLPALVPLEPSSVAVAEAGLVEAPPPVEAAPALVPAQVTPKTPASSSTLSATLSSSKKAKTLEPLIASPGRLEVDLPAAGKVKSVFSLSSPSRVVVDLQDARLPTSKHIDVDEGGVMQLRFGHPKAGIERVVVVVAGGDKPMKPKAKVDGDRLVVTWSW